MARKADRVALITNNALSDTAVRLGLYIESLGPDWHELSPDQLAQVAHGYPSRDTIAKHLRQLQIAGYVERRPGGRGHSDRFRWSFSSGEKPGSKPPLAPENLPDLSGNRSAEKPGSKNLGPGKNPDLNALTRVDARKAVDDDEDEGEPPIAPLSRLAERAIETHGQTLRGCRGALRDYLAARVPQRQQYGYVQSIAAWLEGGTASPFYGTSGGAVPPEDRTGVLAVALNELAGMDETKMSRPVGDIGNLRTKISVLLRDYERNGRERQSGRRAQGRDRGGTGAGGSYDHVSE